MDVNGPDIKRQRHHYDAPQRMPSQSQQPSSAPLPPPSTHAQAGVAAGGGPFPTAPPSQQQPPPSPFHDVSHDGRNLPDPHSFVQQHPPHSGHTTPREARFQPDLDFSRRGSASTVPRSPSNDHPPFTSHRPAPIVTTTDGQHFPPQYPIEATGPVPFPPTDPHVNGNMQAHGLPMHPHDQVAHSMPPGYPDGYAQSPVTGGPHPYGGMPYGPPMGIRPPKKGNRATQACDNCRTRKAKCDEGRPRCGFCAESDLLCNYQSVAPAKLDRVNQAIMDLLESHKNKIETLTDITSGMENRLLSRLEEFMADRVESKQPKTESEQRSPPKPSPMGGHHNINIPSTASNSRDHKLVDGSPSNSFHKSESSGDETVSPSVAQQNAIHIEHNTAAQKLFRWPAIKQLLAKCKGLNFSETTETYVMNFELKKGPLHLYGRGQGSDVDAASLGLDSSNSGNSTVSHPSDDASEGSSPASSADLPWGHGFNPFVGDGPKDGVSGGLAVDNTLKLDAKTINGLHHSYLQNMQIMHPILDESLLTKTIETFKKRYSNSSESGSSKAAFAVPVSNSNVDALRDASQPYTKTMKRKYSDGQHWADSALGQMPPSPKPYLERSPTTAVVLLVLALGKICECREALPGPVPLRESSPSASGPYSPALRTDSPPPNAIRQSPSGYSNTASPMSFTRQNHFSPRSSVGEIPTKHSKNLDIIPGLAYYAQATDILGNMTGSHDITYVQCCLLAGLYAGQLANSVESLTWIQYAARGCCILCRDPNLRGHPKSRQNSIRIAFYTALQLESDILAEIDFPPSGIRKVENVQYPHGYVPEDERPAEDVPHKSVVMKYYSYQLHLRQLLDWIQQEVYPPNKGLVESIQNKNMRSIFNKWLTDEWRGILPPEINWAETDTMPRGINDARLRGKYYGAMYIIHRPMVHYALELEAKGELDEFMTAYAQGPGMMAPPKARNHEYLAEVCESASIAIKAAVSSTTAFDEAMDMKRLIVTNIFGTAHAQFGNMLVLSAVYKSRHLKQFISSRPRETMDHLFDRTINFLKKLRPISQTLDFDRFILSQLRDVVFANEDDVNMDPTPATSFS